MNPQGNTALKVLEPETVTQELEVVKTESAEVVARAQELALAIKDDNSYAEAAAYRKTMNGFKKAAVERLEKVRKPAYEAYQETLRLIKEAIAPFDSAMGTLDQPLIAYDAEQERQRKLREAEAAAAAKKLVEDAQVAQAESAEKNGDSAKAQAIINQVPIVPKVVLPATTKPTGTSIRTTWEAEVTDLMALVKAVAEGKAPVEALEANATFLNAQARAYKEHMAIPGVKSVPKKGIANR